MWKETNKHVGRQRGAVSRCVIPEVLRAPSPVLLRFETGSRRQFTGGFRASEAVGVSQDHKRTNQGSAAKLHVRTSGRGDPN